jgi:hypothetical protein
MVSVPAVSAVAPLLVLLVVASGFVPVFTVAEPTAEHSRGSCNVATVSPRPVVTEGPLNMSYNVSFAETGLPSGLSWLVNFNGTQMGLTTGPGLNILDFASEPNGSYPYSIADNAGYHESNYPYNGMATVQAGALTLSLSYVQVVYPVNFSESGLRAGLAWNVTWNSTPMSLTTNGGTDTLSFASEPNGTYPYSIAGNPGFHQNTIPYSGTESVNGGALVENLGYSAITYSVAFSESGLPSGLNWTVTIDGSAMNLTTNGATDTLSFQEPNGTSSYSITDVSGWHQTTLSYAGNVVVMGGPITEPTLGYTRVTYTVVWSEMGLPSGLSSWKITVNNVPMSIATDGLTDSLVWTGLANGTYPYSIVDIAGWHQSTAKYVSNLTVNGGTAPIDGTGTGYASTLVYGLVTYEVTISEYTLPAEFNWRISVNGNPQSLLTSGGPETLTWMGLANGSWSYSIADISGWHQTTLAYNGNLTVNGGTGPIGGVGYSNTLSYYKVNYTVVFSESGLPTGLDWTVTVGNVTMSLVTNGLTDTLAWTGDFRFVNGTHSYSISVISNWFQPTLPPDGNLTVSGGNLTEPTLAYTEVAYSVTFSEHGLPANDTFEVTLDGVSNFSRTDSSNDTIDFIEAAGGPYPFSISDVAGWHQTTLGYKGNVTVSDGPVMEPMLKFLEVTYALVFTETGLPGGTNWLLNFTQPYHHSRNSTASTITMNDPNGTYNFTTATSDKNYAPTALAGSIQVNGSSVVVPVRFVLVTFEVLFRQTGLPLGANWSVVLAGTPRWNATPTITFLEPNGTYAVNVVPIPAYTGTPSELSLIVHGKSLLELITFTPTTAPIQPIDLIVGAAVAIGIGGVTILLLRRGKKPPEGGRATPPPVRPAPPSPRNTPTRPPSRISPPPR